MNSGLESGHASINYYDGDYPSEEHSRFPENFDETTVLQGLRHDVRRYKQIASQTGGPILELCCGTGRVALPLARQGLEVIGVDICAALLERFRAHLSREDKAVADRVTMIEQDIRGLSLGGRKFPLIIIAFNSLLCILNFEDQIRTLQRAAAHLCDNGLLVLDIVNPLRLKIEGDPVPKPFFTRRNPDNGNTYTRFAMMGALDENQKQMLHGWYDEVQPDGTVRRTPYSLHWRPIFRFEIEAMLKLAGLDVAALEGGHLRECFTALSPRMFIQARKFSG